MIKLVDLIEVTDSHLSIMDGASPMLFISKDFMKPDLINPVILKKEVIEVRVFDNGLQVWLKED